MYIYYLHIYYLQCIYYLFVYIICTYIHINVYYLYTFGAGWTVEAFDHICLLLTTHALIQFLILCIAEIKLQISLKVLSIYYQQI